jgi:hypothetical protein
MEQRWVSVEVREHTVRGTYVHRGLFPQVSIETRQVETQSCVLAQLMDSWLSVRSGVTIEVEVSYSEPYTLELDAEEARLMNTGKKVKGVKRWERVFIPLEGGVEVKDAA